MSLETAVLFFCSYSTSYINVSEYIEDFLHCYAILPVAVNESTGIPQPKIIHCVMTLQVPKHEMLPLVLKGQ